MTKIPKLPPIISIKDALFKKTNTRNDAYIFPKPLSFEIPNRSKPLQKWCAWGPEKSKFLNILSRREYCIADSLPTCVQYHKKGQSAQDSTYIDFKTEFMKFKPPPTSPHLSARYEFFKSEFDEKLSTFIKNVGNTSTLVGYNLVNSSRKIDLELYENLLQRLDLKTLENSLVIGLSNGQMRRSRLARSLLTVSDLLIVDDLYLGLDATSRKLMSETINWFNETHRSHSMVIIGLRPQDEIPTWCTDIAIVEEEGISYQGPIVQETVASYKEKWNSIEKSNEQKQMMHKNGIPEKNFIDKLISNHEWFNMDPSLMSEYPLHYHLNGISVVYRGRPVLNNINWEIKKQSVWHIQGDNGSGKSTLISLLTADHPQSWNSKILDEFNQPRKVGSTNYFDINSSIATSSPEIHSIALKYADMTLQDLILSGLNSDSSNNFTVPKSSSLLSKKFPLCFDYIDYFHLDHLKLTKFNDLSVNDQKLGLFIRCLVKLPKLLILDESFSGMELKTIEKCHEFLSHWPGTVLMIAHLPEEVPSFCKSSIKLVKPGKIECSVP